MTLSTATRSRRQHSAFTLVEMLVVIGIICVLIAILFPAINSAYKRAVRTRMQLDIQTLSTALEAYRNDMRQYPIIDYNDPVVVNNITGQILAFANPGAVELCQALLGPGLQSQDGYGVAAGNSTSTGANSAIAPGFTLRPRGQVYGPYVEPNRFKIVLDANAASISVSGPTVAQPGWCFADRYGNPILYFSGNMNATYKSTANPGPKNPIGGYCANWTSQMAAQFNPATPAPMYNVHDNYTALSWTNDPAPSPGQPSGTSGSNGAPGAAGAVGAVTRMQLMLGDSNADGWIQSNPTGGSGAYNETPAATGPYLLWCAGPDGQYGIDMSTTTDLPSLAAMVPACDDATNFTK